MVNAQEWLDQNYPNKKTEQIYISQQLEGILDCSGYDYLLRISISLQVDSSKFQIKKSSYYGSETQIIHLIQAQEWLDKYYAKDGTCLRKKQEWNSEKEVYEEKKHFDHGKTRAQITKLSISHQNLEGSLDLSDFTNLEELYCFNDKLTSLNLSNCDKLKKLSCPNNHLTQITYPSNPKQLTELDIRNNHLPPQNLSIFSQFKNLEQLWINDNPFTGSLEPLKDLSRLYNLVINNTNISGSLEPLKDLNKLIWLYISHTDLNSGTEYLPDSLERIEYDTQDRPNCKLTEIKDQLDQWCWLDIHESFIDKYGRIHKTSWLSQGFTKEQVKEWITAGVEPDGIKFINWFLNFKKLDFPWALENDDEFKDLRDKYHNFIRTCEECQEPNTSGDRDISGWCQSCNAKHFEEDFPKWTSGNLNIDQFIQKCQLEATSPWNVLEWIPYEQFTNIQHIANGGFGKVEKTQWERGSIVYWNNKEKNWERSKDYKYDKSYNKKDFDYKTVALKTLTNSQNLNSDFLTELTLYKMFRSEVSQMVPCYGVSKDREGNYILVMDYMKEGNLREYLKKNYQKLDFDEYGRYPKLNFLKQISQGLKDIHRKNLVHSDFHSGNIIVDGGKCCITDLGLCQPVNETDNSKVFGVLPYVAPEVLYNKPYTQASDVYSFGIIAHEILTCLPPYAEQSHDANLALQICQGIRPQFPKQVKYPQLLVDLINRCWDNEPNNRPTAREISRIMSEWLFEYNGSLKKDTNLYQQIQEAETHNQTLPQEIRYPKYQQHSQAVYTSRLLPTNEITQRLLSEQYGGSAGMKFKLDSFDLITIPEDLQIESSTQNQINPIALKTTNNPKPTNLFAKLENIITNCITKQQCLPCYLYEQWKDKKESELITQIEVPPKNN